MEQSSLKMLTYMFLGVALATSCYASSDKQAEDVQLSIAPAISHLLERTKRNSPPISQNGHYCLDGSKWIKDCNECYCEHGVSYCTQLLCHLPPGIRQRTCYHGITWQNECNICFCKNGIPVCSNTACRSQLLATQNYNPLTGKCYHGTSWKIGCNDCFCNNGLAACTLKFCNNPAPNPFGECIHGTTWKDGCNDCFCHLGIPSCTLKNCKEIDNQCQHGTSWNDGCNNCYCDNGVAACTLKACAAPISGKPSLPAPSVQTCKDGSYWKEQCNDCYCHQGIPACTLKACFDPSHPVVVLPPAYDQGFIHGPSALPAAGCKPGQSFKVDCNTCTCLESGPPACTKKVCPVTWAA